jgi:hypothetical protein
MKKIETRYSASKVISLAALLAMQTLPSTLLAQAATNSKANTEAARKRESQEYMKIDALSKESMTLVAVMGDCTIYENSKKELLVVDATTGDIKPIAKTNYEKLQYAVKKNGKITFPPNCFWKGEKVIAYKIKDINEELKVLGIDKEKHVIMQNAKGENVYLDPTTGDMKKCAQGVHFKEATLIK